MCALSSLVSLTCACTLTLFSLACARPFGFAAPFLRGKDVVVDEETGEDAEEKAEAEEDEEDKAGGGGGIFAVGGGINSVSKTICFLAISFTFSIILSGLCEAAGTERFVLIRVMAAATFGLIMPLLLDVMPERNFGPLPPPRRPTCIGGSMRTD